MSNYGKEAVPRLAHPPGDSLVQLPAKEPVATDASPVPMEQQRGSLPMAHESSPESSSEHAFATRGDVYAADHTRSVSPDIPVEQERLIGVPADRLRALIAAEQALERKRQQQRERNRRWRERHPEAHREANRKWNKSPQGRATKAALQRRYREAKGQSPQQPA